MNQARVSGAAILLAAVVVGCSSSAADDKLMEDVLANQEKILEFKLKNDDASLAEAKKLEEKLAELSKKIDALSPDRQEALKKKYKDKRDALAEKEKNLPTAEDRLMEDMLVTQQKMADLLQKKGGDSAAELKKAADHIMEIGKKVAALPPDKQMALQKKWEPKIKAAQEKMMKDMMPKGP